MGLSGVREGYLEFGTNLSYTYRQTHFCFPNLIDSSNKQPMFISETQANRKPVRNVKSIHFFNSWSNVMSFLHSWYSLTYIYYAKKLYHFAHTLLL